MFERAEQRMIEMGFSEAEMDFIFTDWPNQLEHYAWLLKASREEIQDWIDASGPEA